MINQFLRDNLALDVMKISSVSHSRAKRCVSISFISEEDIINFEKLVCSGIEFPGTGTIIDGYRIDSKYITARLTGAPPWVEQFDIESLFNRWGIVISSRRGTSSLSNSSGVEGVWGSGWVWDGEWVVRLQCAVNSPSIPTCIQACGDVWQVRYEGAPTVCFRCGDPQHLASACKAAKRE